MIALLSGTLAGIAPDHIIIDVQGVGYAVSVAPRTVEALPNIGGDIRLNIYTHVREDQLTLYGFQNHDEQTLFRRLLSVTGVGPRLALTILSALPPGELVTVVAGEETAALSAIPGIGKKTAERIIIDLRDRLLKDHANLLQMPGAGAKKGAHHQDALSALVNLGYPERSAMQALRKIHSEQPDQPLGQMIKQALKTLTEQ